MLARASAVAAILACPLLSAAAGQKPTTSRWVLQSSTLTYHVTHPLHRVQGVSHAARGEGICAQGVCRFLIADQVKTFTTGDSARDVHMQQVVRAALDPLITVRTSVPESALSAAKVQATLAVHFAGQRATFPDLTFGLQHLAGGRIRLSGTIPAAVGEFKIKPPQLLFMAISNQIPITVVMVWAPARP
ncbi:MAG: hypothetical protein ACRD2E_02360 [Terriglobales bacterium]